MAEGADHPGAGVLAEVPRRELVDVEREICAHRLVAALDEGRAPRDRLAGDSASRAFRTARLLLACEPLFWDGVAWGIS
jgi:hypothetical protein